MPRRLALVRPRIAARLESLSSIRTQRWSDPPGQEPVAKAEPIQPDDGQCGGLGFARHCASGSGFLLHWFATWEPKPKRLASAGCVCQPSRQLSGSGAAFPKKRHLESQGGRTPPLGCDPRLCGGFSHAHPDACASSLTRSSTATRSTTSCLPNREFYTASSTIVPPLPRTSPRIGCARGEPGH